MSAFSYENHYQGHVCIIRTNGYLDRNGGVELAQAVEEGFSRGCQAFILNFSGSPVINSQGVAKLLEVMEIITEKRKGELAYVGLSELSSRFFLMAGLVGEAKIYPHEAAALSAI